MKNAHIAFITYPLHPQIGSTLPIISVLVRRGYRVTHTTSDRFASRVAALGAEIVPISHVPAPADLTEDYADLASGYAIRTLEEITPFYTNNRPSLIIYDFVAFAGRILANKWQIPAIQTSPTFSFDRKYFDEQVKDPEFRKILFKYSKSIDGFLQRFGIGRSDYLFDREKLNIHAMPKALQPCASSVDDSCFYAGRCAGEQPYYGSWQNTNKGMKPSVLVSTSTHYVRGPEYFRMCIDALTGLGWYVILSIADVDPATLGSLPPDFEIVKHASHVKILPHVNMFVCLGGVITSSEAAYHGVPLIVTSHGYHELEWQAENLVRLGVAVHIKKSDTSADTIRRTAIQVLQDTKMRGAVREMQRVVQREAGGEETVNRIEEYLASYSN